MRLLITIASRIAPENNRENESLTDLSVGRRWGKLANVAEKQCAVMLLT